MYSWKYSQNKHFRSYCSYCLQITPKLRCYDRNLWPERQMRFRRRRYDKSSAGLNIPLEKKWQVLRNTRTFRATEHQPMDPQLHACSELSRCHGNRDRLHPHLVAISAREKKKGGREIYELRRKKTNIFCNAKQKKAEGWVTHERGWEMHFVCLFFPPKQNGSNLSYFCKFWEFNGAVLVLWKAALPV